MSIVGYNTNIPIPLIKHKTQNGWTKEAIKEQIRAKNNGKKSVSNGSCAYRGEMNNMCAAGCFISDSDYSPSMEGYSIDDDLAMWNRLKDSMPLDKVGMRSMQIEHDCSHELEAGDVRDVLCYWVDENVEDS